MEIEKETLLLVIVYFMSGYLELPRQHRILIIGDFNFDRMLTENVASVDLSIQNFNVSALAIFNSYTWGLYGLVCDTSNSNAFSSLPSPYSEHFVLFFPNSIIIFI